MKSLIHTRNFLTDYNPEFAVCDSNLTPDQKNWARAVIQSAVELFDKSSPPRYICKTSGEDVLAGVICLTSSLAIDEKFFHDDKNRAIRVFIGCFFKRGSKQVPNLELNRCADLFTKYLDDVWNRKSFFESKPASDSDFEKISSSAINFGDSEFQSTLREYAETFPYALKSIQKSSDQKKTSEVSSETNNSSLIIVIAAVVILAIILIMLR